MREGFEGRIGVEKQLNLLIELQELDTAIAQLLKEKEAIPQKIQTLEQGYLEEESRLKAIRQDLEDLQKKRRSKERELDHQVAEMKKRQGRLLEVKTNKEYSAILHEIEALKEKQSTLEDEVLEALEMIDARGKEVDRETETLKREREACEQQKREWERRLAEAEAQLFGLLEDRLKRVSGMDPELVQTYARIYEVRQGLAVVPVRDRSCSGCFVTLTPQACQEAKRNDRILTCSNCNRILYWKE